MDLACWIFVPVSLVFVTLALVIIVRVGGSYGIPQPDLIRIILTPFGMMNAEKMATWFEFPYDPVNRNRMWLVGRGQGGNLLLLTWSLMGMILMFGFTCNLRAIYMRVDYETPLDTAEQIYKSGKICYDIDWGIDWLKTLNNPWIRKIANKAVSVSNDEYFKLLNEVDKHDNMVMVASGSGKPPSTEHYSKELISSFDMGGWRVGGGGESPWHKSVNIHILQLGQVNKK